MKFDLTVFKYLNFELMVFNNFIFLFRKNLKQFALKAFLQSQVIIRKKIFHDVTYAQVP